MEDQNLPTHATRKKTRILVDALSGYWGTLKSLKWGGTDSCRPCFRFPRESLIFPENSRPFLRLIRNILRAILINPCLRYFRCQGFSIRLPLDALMSCSFALHEQFGKSHFLPPNVTNSVSDV